MGKLNSSACTRYTEESINAVNVKEYLFNLTAFTILCSILEQQSSQTYDSASDVKSKQHEMRLTKEGGCQAEEAKDDPKSSTPAKGALRCGQLATS